jgi:hypothetical protein
LEQTLPIKAKALLDKAAQQAPLGA